VRRARAGSPPFRPDAPARHRLAAVAGRIVKPEPLFQGERRVRPRITISLTHVPDRTRTMTRPSLALSQAEQRRLEKLAEEAGRTPKAMLKHVLRNGFDYTEEFVRKVKEGLAELDAGKGVPRAVVSEQARRIVAKHAAHKKAA